MSIIRDWMRLVALAEPDRGRGARYPTIGGSIDGLAAFS